MENELNDQTVVPTIRHWEFGHPECRGRVCFVFWKDQVEIVCDECKKVIQIVSASELRKTLDALRSFRSASSVAISTILVANWAASTAAQLGDWYC
jgi:hypothetical protein